MLCYGVFCFYLFQLLILNPVCFKVFVTSPCIDPPVVNSPGSETVFTVSIELVYFCVFVTPFEASDDPIERVCKNPQL